MIQWYESIVPYKEKVKLFHSSHTVDIVASYLPLNPIIVEAGAFIGSDTRSMLKKIPDAKIHAFEPVPQLYKQLQAVQKTFPSIAIYPLALSDTIGSAIFYVGERRDRPGTPSQTGSLLKPGSQGHNTRMHFPHTIQVNTTTLDAWAQEHNINQVDFLWLDAQGYELAIIKGAPRLLPSVKAILTEVAFVERYHGQPLYDEMQTYLAKCGFECVGMDRDSRISTFCNALFIQHI